MSLFFLRQKLKNILVSIQENGKIAAKTLGFARATHQEVRTMSVALDNLTAAVNAAVAQLGALSAKVTALEAEIAAGSDDAAKQALADQLTAAVAANQVPA